MQTFDENNIDEWALFHQIYLMLSVLLQHLPAGHPVHCSAPWSFVKLPGGHAMHAICFSLLQWSQYDVMDYWLSTFTTHSLWYPGWHGVHCDCLVALLYWPLGHAVQSDSVWQWPLGSSTQFEQFALSVTVTVHSSMLHSLNNAHRCQHKFQQGMAHKPHLQIYHVTDVKYFY